MAHTRGGGIGNMAGSFDHTQDEVEAKVRVRIIVGGGYGDITEDELDRLIGESPCPILVWRDIATAPVPPREQLMHGRWEALLQDRKGRVVTGYAAYIKSRAKDNPPDRLHRAKPPEWHLQWYSGLNPLGNSMNRVFKPIYWMPIPAPRKE